MHSTQAQNQGGLVRHGLLVLPFAVVFLLFQILWKHEVENHSKQEDHSHAVVGKHRADNLREDVEHACSLGEAKAYTQRKAHDHHVAL